MQEQRQAWECVLKQLVLTQKRRSPVVNACLPTPRTIRRPSDDRLLTSLSDKPLDYSQLLYEARTEPIDSRKTYLYLAYGSNLCAETFKGVRGVRPLSQVNVVVPAISLSFDLAGSPYSEPCFGNIRYRVRSPAKEDVHDEGYHKEVWTKGLVGVVYEVSAADYAYILMTEGYDVVQVDCYPLSPNPREDVPDEPTNTCFRAYTLIQPRRQRPDPDYAQASPRYMKLITDGAREHALPYEYQEYLHRLGTYRRTTFKQELAMMMIATVFGPMRTILFGLMKVSLNDDGTFPTWLVAFATGMFTAIWGVYDGYFKPVFGNGERTINPDESEDPEEPEILDEKAALLKQSKINKPGSGVEMSYV